MRMSFELCIPFLNVLCDSTFWNNPEFGGAVLWRAAQELINEWREGYIGYGASVSFDQMDVIIKASELVSGEDCDWGVGLPGEGSEDAVRCNCVLLLSDVWVDALEFLLGPGRTASEEFESLLLLCLHIFWNW